MSQDEYAFQNTQDQSELNRLRSIEAIFYPATRRRILSAGLKSGSQCLEIGAGAGSIMTWMAGEAGSSGTVTAIDLNTRFLNDTASNVRVLAGDIRSIPLGSELFDLIHARYVLVHIPEAQTVLERLWSFLKPGGSLVIEEPDFSVFRTLDGADKEVQSFDKVHRAIIHMYSSKGLDHALGARLPALFRKLGVKGLVIENDSPISQGGAGVATMMSMSAAQLKEKYLATGEATAHDIENYGKFTRSQDSWAIYYATIAAIGKKQAVA